MGLDRVKEGELRVINYKEKDFEDFVEECLMEQGYIKGNTFDYNRELALDTKTLFSFIKATQPKEWQRHESNYPGNAEKAFLDRLTKEINSKEKGLIHVLRQGFIDRGVKFRLVYFKPETSLNEDLIDKYSKNIFHVTRQLHYSVHNENSIDVVLFINGIPVVTIELKNPMTGQNVDNAIHQYKADRNPNEPIFGFNRRALVNFAVDPYLVFMTTELKGDKTFFLPFNQGSEGAGNIGGKDNPTNHEGFDTEYLFRNILSPDSLLEILHKFIHKEVDKVTGKVKIIFPRYHQIDVVRKLLSDVYENGAGKNYLIQHSAGSGKSNSIAWLAHRLSGLHNAENKAVFSSVIVITDRKILDSQLQETIYQFDHVAGVVEKIDENSKQLLSAINSGKKIIITTLQKFPVIYGEVKKVEGQNFAIIVDEAHSSQTGQAATKLKVALADISDALEEYSKIEESFEENKLDPQDEIVKELVSQGTHPNLSFFAFTATPKAKTLQMFGERGKDGKYRAFHIYSMRQAIEEKFILDVLENYMTYNMYFNIVKNIPDDPELNSAQGVKAIKKYQSLHPHNLAQKTAIMVEQFREVTRHKLSGRAKAMVVTASRLHAVRYCEEFKNYIKSKGYNDLDVLVAFSGEVDDNGVPKTEEKMNQYKGNSVKESELKEVFKTDDFHFLIVAEKYQTGFDEPLLHTMFVDKKLSDVKAVQTLSRLNRTCEGKEDTFVLDFVNSAEDIQKAFQPFYESTVLEKETNPNMLYDIKHLLDQKQVYTQEEVESFAKVFFSKRTVKDDLGKVSGFLKPAMDRYLDLEELAQKEFKSSLSSFVRLYAFITQVVRMYDKELHEFYTYAKFLLKVLPSKREEDIDLEGKISMDYYKIQKSYQGQIELVKESEGTVYGAEHAGGAKPQNKDTLSEIIKKINERFGTQFTGVDKVMEQIIDDFRNDKTIVNFAKNNGMAIFGHIYNDLFSKILVNGFKNSNEFYTEMLKDKEKLEFFKATMLPIIYNALRGVNS
ncbi:type I site-specific deoxyribonuclease, HsdR family [Clostridiales bacterium oral taxon 876 str. F0540]|nr:type I site-specific deoxyribonuclease, HsdR family [Clostridiales bacterium oral taxon 876 str. F0540]